MFPVLTMENYATGARFMPAMLNSQTSLGVSHENDNYIQKEFPHTRTQKKTSGNNRRNK